MTYPWEPKVSPVPKIRDIDFERAAMKLGCENAVLRAVWRVEAAGRGFRSDGTLERRFEPHHFPERHWADIGFRPRSGEAAWRASVRLSNDTMAEKAYGIDGPSMLRATSWGGPQIMGFNYKSAGFSNVKSMVTAMASDERSHLDAFTDLIADWGLTSALRSRDWEAFARRYNGPGQVSRYATLLDRAYGVTSASKRAADMEDAVRKEGGGKSKPVLRRGATGRNVKKLQTMLDVEPDGVFGPLTEQAVMDFQRRSRITVDGVVGAVTWRHLRAIGQPTDDVSDRPASATPVAGLAATGLGGVGAMIAAASANPWVAAGLITIGIVIAGWFIWSNLESKA